MHYVPTVTRDSIIDMAAYLTRDLARLERNAEQAKVFPRMLAKIEGERDGVRTALAYCGGILGLYSVEDVIALARRERPTITGELSGVPVPAGHWPVDHERGE